MMNRRNLLSTVLAAFCLAGCASAKYAVFEKFGIPKRDLFKKYIIAARDEQTAAGKQFQDALTQLKSIYGFNGGKLETAYESLKTEHERAKARSASVKKRIRDVESVSSALFTEWEQEIQQITTPTLAADSRSKLASTRAHYETMHAALIRAEQSMDPVLTKLNDNVLYLKHNLNSQAIASLKGEATAIQEDIGRLIDDMHASIRQADDFIKTLQ